MGEGTYYLLKTPLPTRQRKNKNPQIALIRKTSRLFFEGGGFMEPKP